MEQSKCNFSKKKSLIIFAFSALCFAGFLQYWLWERAHLCSVASVGSMILISVVSLLYGRILLPLFPLPREIAQQRPIQMLFGFLIFNTLLFLIVILNLWSVKNSFFLLAGIAFLGTLFSFFKKELPKKCELSLQEQVPGMLAILVSAIGATLLCCDPLSMPTHENGMIYFPVWGDSFTHSYYINAFAQADGLHKVSSIYMSGMPLHFYHYASYIVPALVVSLTHVSSFVIFSCFLIPVGVFLLGLAGFTLAHAFWKGWPAVAATMAVLFLPDGYYQGFQNKFLSYHFHLHVGPASFYGIACGALAWLFMLQGCRLKNFVLVFGAYLFLGMMLCYKAQLFVANAFILMLFPCFFFLQCGKVKNFLMACSVTLLFFFVVHFSQRFPSVPVIALNGGGIHKYCKVLSQWMNNGLLHTFFLEHLWTHPWSFPWYQLLAAGMVYFCTLGLWGIGVVVLLFVLRRKIDGIVWSFPLWIIVNYLIMSLGLSLDSRHLADPEELVNRPLMWAYFVVVTWTTSGFYFLIWGDQLPKTFLQRVLAAMMLVVGLLMPLTFAHGLETMPVWNITLRSNAVPAAMVEALDFIKQKSSPYDIVQDSEGDHLYVVTGFTERQAYAISVTSVDPLLTTRLKELEHFKQMTTENEIKEFLHTHAIAWYLLHPETQVAWPDSFKNSAIFESDGYRVYHCAVE